MNVNVLVKACKHWRQFVAENTRLYSPCNTASTCTNLLTSLNDWTQNTRDGCQTIVNNIDFSKAFDVVQHDKLFLKLRACGIDGILLQWIINLFIEHFVHELMSYFHLLLI